MRYVLNLDSETNRILSAGIMPHPPEEAVLVDMLPDGNIVDYLYINGEYVYDPLPEPEPVEPDLTLEERVTVLEGKVDGEMADQKEALNLLGVIV